jgi:Ca-activated chloride channel family protein
MKDSFDKLFIIRFLIFSFLIISLSSPYIQKSIEQKKDGYSIVLSLDASGSMSESGKFIVVKDVVNEFISKRIDDQVGVVVFGDSAFIATPLTYDKSLLKYMIDKMYVGVAGQKTAIADSLAQSIKLLDKSETKSKVVILLTDGLENASKLDIHKVVSIAKKENIKIYTIGIGYDFDKRYLDFISNTTNGKSFVALSKVQLQNIYKTIDTLEKSKIKSNNIYYKEYYFMYPLFISILFSFIYLYFRRKETILKVDR